MRRSIGFLCISLIMMVCFWKCTSSGNETPISVAVIPKGTTNIFWQSVHAGALKAGIELGVDVIWVGPQNEDERQRQISIVDNQTINQVSGIVLAPLDDTALMRPVRNASEKNIPVIIIDSALKDADDFIISFVATDNYAGGQLAGKRLAEMLAEKGNVIMLRFQEGSASTEKRENGFLDAISEFPDIKVISDEQYAGATSASGQQASENLLLRFKDANGSLAFDGIFCPNESSTYGMLQALRRNRLAGQVKFIGFDTSQALIDALEQDEIHGLVVQDPFNMGYLGVKTMYQHLKGKKIEKRLDTGVTLVTNTNLKNPDVQALLNPDLEKWLNQ